MVEFSLFFSRGRDALVGSIETLPAFLLPSLSRGSPSSLLSFPVAPAGFRDDKPSYHFLLSLFL